MATNTYVALDKKTVSSAVAYVEFTGIPSTYTDLIIVANGNTDAASTTKLNVGNGSIDTTSIYSWTVLSGTGSAANSYRESGVAYTQNERYANWDAVNYANTIIQIQNYSSTAMNKTWLSRGNNAGAGVDVIAGLWRSNSAINVVRISCTNAGRNFAVGTTFSLYGIAAEGTAPTPKAIGGAIYDDATYYYHVFGSTGAFVPSQSITADVLVVAGGGGGAHGGGGAGGVTYYASQSLTTTSYTCTVGAGGTGGPANHSTRGTSGTNSQFGALTASVGGGAGGQGAVGYTLGLDGGSGGGGAPAGVAFAGGSPTTGQGFAGGTSGPASGYYSAGGGGGSGAAGATGDSGLPQTGGNGGVGLTTYSSWVIATGAGQVVSGVGYIAAGGGGGSDSGIIPGGFGGGGYGSVTVSQNAQAGTGSGGGGSSNQAGGIGGSGVVIVRYLKA